MKEQIQKWDEEMWNIVRTLHPQLKSFCKMEEEILHDGGVWVDNHQSPLITNHNTFLRVQMRYEDDFHFGVVEADEENTDNPDYQVFEQGMIPDERESSVRFNKARDLLMKYGCL